MLAVTVPAHQVWRAATLDEPSCWYYRIPPPFLASVDPLLREAGVEPTSIRLHESLRTTGNEALQPVRDTLERGRGFVVLENPGTSFEDRQRVILYWLVGQILGRPVVQNVQGALLYDVRDTGQDVRYGARFSVTNAESTFHTDASFFQELSDYVGLLCLRTARAGGVSQLVSGAAIYQELLARCPEVVAELARPFHVDRRGGLRPGEAPTARFPVLARHESGVVFRYLRYWIESGHDRANEPLTDSQRHALDTLDALLAEPAFRVEFMLREGETLLFNNRWLLHNRTAFEDFEESERRRHLVRLWLTRHEGGSVR